MLNQPIKIKVRTISSGPAGHLSVIESSRDLPFSIKRIYYLHGLNENTNRGYHAHRTIYQCLVAVHGAFSLRLEGPAGKFAFDLTRPDEGVLIPPAYWREMHDLHPDTVIMVMASDDYDEDDYIRNYNDFKNWQKSLLAEKFVPYLDLSRQLTPFKEVEETIGRVVKSGRFINGPQVEGFEKEFAATAGVSHVVGVANGLDALTLILKALGLGPGDEVVICAAGFIATALAVTRVGARPVFVDCRADANLDPAKLRLALSARTRAIIPTHLYGFPADMVAIGEAIKGLDIPVIEDACQAHGATYQGRPCGSLGLAASFSFYPTKNMGAMGDAGCVATDDAQLAERIRKLANYGASQKYNHELAGYNSRLDEIQAALLRLKLPHLPAWNERRIHLSATYEQEFQIIEGLELPRINPNTRPCLHIYGIRVKNKRRNELADFLRKAGIETNIHYPLPLHRQECYLAEYGDLSFPEAEAWAEETLSLPLDASHHQKEIDQVCRAVKRFFQGANS